MTVWSGKSSITPSSYSDFFFSKNKIIWMRYIKYESKYKSNIISHKSQWTYRVDIHPYIGNCERDKRVILKPLTIRRGQFATGPADKSVADKLFCKNRIVKKGIKPKYCEKVFKAVCIFVVNFFQIKMFNIDIVAQIPQTWLKLYLLLTLSVSIDGQTQPFDRSSSTE